MVSRNGSEKSDTNHDVTLLADIDDRIPLGRAVIVGLQHVLAMDLYIVPIILAGALAMNVKDTSVLIQMTFLAAGIATVIQVILGIKLPVVQGASYIPIGALASIGGTLGLPAMIGSMIPGALIVALLGYFKLIGRVIKFVIPPLVAGTVILIIGIALMPVAMGNIFTPSIKEPAANLVPASVSAVILILLLVLGSRATGKLRFVRLFSVILALAGGTLIASFFGEVDLSPLKSAKWLEFPKIFAYGAPTFHVTAVITMVFIYLVVLVESAGTWFTVGSVTDKEITEERLNGGVGGEGLGCLVSSVVGAMPVTGYSTNAGIIAVTGIASKRAILAAGGILVILGLVPKCSTLISCIPESAVMGVFSIVTVIIAMNGVRVLKNISLTERNMLVIGVPILLTLAGVVIPDSLVSASPLFVQYLISSGMAIGALAALLLNLVLPRDAVA